MKKKIVLTVTNDLTYDQRMIRIAATLARGGYVVTLVGRRLKDSLPLSEKPFAQKRLTCFASRGFLFYAEYNIRLFFYLLRKKMDVVCAIDLDTIIPCLLVSRMRNVTRVYDAHELFCEMKEIVSRPRIYRAWKWIERRTVPHFRYGYTVNSVIAEAFHHMYGVNYEVIRNVPVLRDDAIPLKENKYILYQGAVNEGRCFESLIPAMKQVNATLLICGNGNFMDEAQRICRENALENKVVFLGKVAPEALRTYTLNAWAGVTLFDDVGKSNYYSLANRFFDYMHAGVPQLCVDFPVYREIVQKYPFALLTANTDPVNIANSLQRLLDDEALYKTLQMNCLAARQQLNWQQEEKKLLNYYQQFA